MNLAAGSSWAQCKNVLTLLNLISLKIHFLKSKQFNSSNLKGIYMEYKGYTIIQKPEGFAIVDAKFNQEIKCKSVQACKVRISKLIETRIKFNI